MLRKPRDPIFELANIETSNLLVQLVELDGSYEGFVTYMGFPKNDLMVPRVILIVQKHRAKHDELMCAIEEGLPGDRELLGELFLAVVASLNGRMTVNHQKCPHVEFFERLLRQAGNQPRGRRNAKR